MSVSRVDVAGSQLAKGQESRTLSLLESERRALARIAAGAPLTAVLQDLVAAIEAQSDVPVHASIHLLDDAGQKLVGGIGPSLPRAYLEAMEGRAIGPDM